MGKPAASASDGWALLGDGKDGDLGRKEALVNRPGLGLGLDELTAVTGVLPPLTGGLPALLTPFQSCKEC